MPLVHANYYQWDDTALGYPRRYPPGTAKKLANISYNSKPYWTSLTIVLTFAYMAVGYFIPNEMDVDISFFWIAALLFAVPATIFAWFLPRMDAGPMQEVWRLPKNAFLLNRTLVRICGSTLIGMAISYSILAFSKGGMFVPLAVLNLFSAVAFNLSASKRMRRHPKSEFAMPLPLPYPFTSMRKNKFRL